MLDYSNNALHMAEPEAGLEPTLTEELVNKGFATAEDDHCVILTHHGVKIAVFSAMTTRQYIRAECEARLILVGAK